MADPTAITAPSLVTGSPPAADANGAGPAGFKPYIPDETVLKEFTFPAVVTGTCLGLIFSASSIYLVLKVGMTVSASIPVAVLAITLFRAFSKAFRIRQATVLENNIVQTAGSAGESIAFGVGVTMPALLLLGFQMEPVRIMVVSVLGGILGILAMIPLRRAFIVKMHGRPGQPGTLLYPEGTACAQVLISGEKGGTTGKTVFVGFGVAFLFKFLVEGMNVLAATVKVPFAFINRAARFAGDMAPELLGVGYIIGLRTSAIMMGGAVLGYLVIIPIVYFFGVHSAAPIPPGTTLISSITSDDALIKELRNNYLLFIGAGCVATAGIISMLRTLPMIVRSITAGLSGITSSGTSAGGVRRTENDMPMSVVFGGSAALIVLLALFLAGEVGVVSAIAGGGLVVLFGFLFVTVSARLTGEIGSSSNPISGMTVATLMVTCLIFLGLGWTSSVERLLALSIAAVVCVAASNGGTTAQSLKTGFLVGGTPKAMQWAILVGALISALVIGGTLILFNKAGTVYSRARPLATKAPDLTLTSQELGRLDATDTYKEKSYKVWSTRGGSLTKEGDGFTPREEVLNLAKEKPGTYLVDAETGKLAFQINPYFSLTPPELARLTETETIEGAAYKVWSTRDGRLTEKKTDYEPRPEVVQLARSEPGTYLVNSQSGKLTFRINPSLPSLVLTNDELGRLQETDTHQGKTYKVWGTRNDLLTVAAPGFTPREEVQQTAKEQPGMYLVDPDTGKLSYLKDPGIMGKLDQTDDGTKVQREFDAPKTQVMGIIINGVLAKELNWTMVAIGAMIALMLELCGVSALAFAVGLYVPIQNSVPIFLGGICRWVIDKYLAKLAESEAGDVANDPEARARAEIEAIKKSETSPGVLLASGFIAGGSIAGVVAAFLEFSPNFKKSIDLSEKLKGTFLDSNMVSGEVTSGLLFLCLAGFLLLTGLGILFRQPKEGTAGRA